MDEIWKPIPNTDYAVSNTGKVASMKKGWRVMKGNKDGNGYASVCLCDGGGGARTVKVHKLVAEAFLGPRPTPKHEVNHIDGIRTNPHVDNLEWVTRSGNQRHRFDVLRHCGPRGEANGNTKITEAKARKIIQRCATGETQRRVAADYGVAQCTISNIVTGKTWAWLG